MYTIDYYGGTFDVPDTHALSNSTAGLTLVGAVQLAREMRAGKSEHTQTRGRDGKLDCRSRYASHRAAIVRRTDGKKPVYVRNVRQG